MASTCQPAGLAFSTPSSANEECTSRGAASKCSQKATSARRVRRRRSEMSQPTAAASVARPASTSAGICHSDSKPLPRARARTAAAAAQVMGTRKRRQCSAAAMAAAQVAAGQRSGWPASSKATVARPASQATVSTMAGNARRRRRTKSSARPQATALIARSPSGARVSAFTSQRSDSSTSSPAMTTKMSLKPVSRRKCSSSASEAPRLDATWRRSASAASAEMAPAMTASSNSSWLIMVGLPGVGAHC
mmetsp:Transcript_12005/g.29362  ORF Transcript_12005/g.29362 Transcript_12005/m.29362 type:complete len:249 (-) Transcript_12005:55-801(-)